MMKDQLEKDAECFANQVIGPLGATSLHPESLKTLSKAYLRRGVVIEGLETHLENSRDRLAVAAMQGLLAGDLAGAGLAEMAYTIADAMFAEKSRRAAEAGATDENTITAAELQFLKDCCFSCNGMSREVRDIVRKLVNGVKP